MKRILPILILLSTSLVSFSQKADTVTTTGHFNANITLTSKGISTIPNLSLGKPAVLFDLSMGRKKISFDPMFRFSLEGKPWTFIFWLRYRAVDNDKLQLTLGAHPAFSFSTKTYTEDGIPKDVQIVRRYLAAEIAPMYKVTKTISAGIYYLNAHGIDPNTTGKTSLLAVRASFSNVRLSEKFYLRINPQVYYLNMDGVDGFYFNSTINIARKNFPLSISGLINEPIKTNITAGNEFLWNVGLVYAFSGEYLEK